MNQNSGGHRYGSGQFLTDYYTPEAYNGGLLDEVGNKLKKPPIEAALAATPLDDAMTTGLLSKDNGGNYDFGGKSTDTTSKAAADDGGLSAWGSNKDGVNYSVDTTKAARNALTGMQALGPLGALAGLASSVTKSPDPLGQFAYQALAAQVQRDRIASIEASNPNSAGLTSRANAMYGDALGNLMGLTNSFGTGGGGGYSSGGDYGGFGGDMGDTGSVGGNSGGTDNGHDNSGYAKGGYVKGGLLSGPDPKGPDDGYAALDDGEYVIKASAVKKYGKAFLEQINNGKYKG